MAGCKKGGVMENQPREEVCSKKLMTGPSEISAVDLDELPKQPIGFVPPILNKRANCQKFRPKLMWIPSKEEIPPFSDNTTVMIKNIPKKYRRGSFMEFLDKCCLEHQLEYDFLYLPMKFKTGENKGYAFVNCTSASVANKMKEVFQGYNWGTYQTPHGGTYASNKLSDAAWARIQGKDALVRHFAKSHFRCHTYQYLPVVISPPRNGSAATTPSTLTIIGELKAKSKH